MDKLPKIAIARLKAARDASNAPGSAGQPDAFEGARHPDANLLAAFVENAVTESERNQVLSHLAECDDCREIAAAVAAPAEETTQPILVSTTHRWRPRLVLRWAVLAAAVATMTLVVVLHRDGWKHAPEISKVAPPPAPPRSVGTAAKSPAPLPLPQLGKTGGTAQAQNPPPAAMAQIVEPERIPGSNKRPVRRLATPHETIMASVQSPKTFRAAHVTAAKVAQPQSRALGVGAQPAFPVTADASRMQALQKKAAPTGVQTAALWSISPAAKVQRSTDGGNTFQALELASEVKFRAVAALGNDVWAGGTAGALFHSADSGATWSRVNIDSGGAVTEDISAIQLHDPQRLTITTTSGAKWASEDSGQHWHQQP